MGVRGYGIIGVWRDWANGMLISNGDMGIWGYGDGGIWGSGDMEIISDGVVAEVTSPIESDRFCKHCWKDVACLPETIEEIKEKQYEGVFKVVDNAEQISPGSMARHLCKE